MDGSPIRSSCGLRGKAHEVRLRFAKERLPAPGAVDPRMADYHKEVPFGTNTRLLFRQGILAPGTDECAGFVLTERTGRIPAATHVEKLEPGPALVGQRMTSFQPFEQVLPLEIGEIGAGSRRRIAKGVYQIPGPYHLLGLHQEERLMFVRLRR